MVWQDYSKRLKGLLALEGSPIAVTYSMAPASGAKKGKRMVCRALLDARDGAVINLSAETCACPGGAWHLGLAPRPSGDEDKFLKRFLVEGEKLFCSIAAFNRAMTLSTQPPCGLADYVILSPLEKAQMPPDLVVFLCHPEQACRLVTLATYRDGIPPRAEIAGSLCHMVIAYPIVSGELNISLMDYTARRWQKYRPDQMFVTIPYHRMPGLMDSIDACSAGTAEVEFPSGMRRGTR
jgi:uncharacterized protein (DUF169 family)